ncbi:hypothetical protein [Pseudomonas protegens]|uniref:hypothetical protein n=1 Tax=Pseudomonas protegens TaxID=380021 RepID=UPI000C9A1741|nr:hypothetical protein [Pseudomonas protegens]PNG30050.1 hypothetical protein A1348_22310 [Pseudomonas protegens]
MSQSNSNLSPQQQWQQAVLTYARDINHYVETGIREGWKGLKEPNMPDTEHLLQDWQAALEASNQAPHDEAARQAFRQDWPPAHFPLTPRLESQGRMIPTLALLPDGSLLARIGAPYEAGFVVHIDDARIQPLEQVECFGMCPQRRYFAWGRADGIQVTDGWNGPQVASFPWPAPHAGLPAGLELEDNGRPSATSLIPFPDGRRVLLVSADGIFVLAADGATRLLRSLEDIQQDLADGVAAEDLSIGLSMEHGAVSPDGQWIAIGEQSGMHLVFDARLQQVAQIGPASEYPHFAHFNQRGDRLLLNACHFYGGASVGVAVADLPGLSTDFYSDDPRTPVLQEGARVYAAASRGDEFIIGDAYGYLRAISETGEERWQHYIGSTLTAMDISVDGKTLVAATYAGIIVQIALDSGRPDWQIGTGEHHELRRWLFWKDFAKPLLW